MKNTADKSREVITAYEAASFWIGSTKRTPDPNKIGRQFGLSGNKVIRIINKAR